jgi:hypothetical protein
MGIKEAANKVVDWFRHLSREHLTKILGGAQITVAAIAANGIIPSHQLKYWMTASGLLTAWRGFVNSKNAQ